VEVVNLWIVILYYLALPRFCSLRIREIALFDVDGTEWITLSIFEHNIGTIEHTWKQEDARRNLCYGLYLD